MMKLKNTLMIETEKLNKMISDNDSININDFVLEQSIKVDKLVLSYTKLKLKNIHKELEILLPILNQITITFDSLPTQP